jgi:hypothetical protein
MDKLLFVQPLLDLLAQGRFFHRALATSLRAVAALVVLFSLTPFFQAGKLIFELPAHGIPGGVFFEIFFAAAVYAVAHVLLIRARDIAALDPGEYYALRAAPILLRLGGEAYACFVSLVAVGAGIFVWFTGLGQARVLNSFVLAFFPGSHSDPSFMGGIGFMLTGLLVAVAALVLAYALAETLTLVTRRALAREREAMGNHRHVVEPPVYRSRFGS